MGGSDSRVWRLIAVLGLALLLCVSMAAAAWSDSDPPAGQDSPPVDTQYTPVAKDSSDWYQVSGARWPKPEAPAGSPVPEDVDLFTVSFRDSTHGIAAGTRCEHAGDEPCVGTPVIYSYTVSADGPQWTAVTDLPGSDRQGFVGSVRWLGDGHALAVGGDGHYPRREPAEDVRSSAYRDPAGNARAWLLDGGAWSEITAELPPAMGGLTALAFSSKPADCPGAGSECGFAGGLAQLWRWQDGRFQPAREIPDADQPERAALFRYRVRDIAYVLGPYRQFVPSFITSNIMQDGPFYAVTSGCCGGSVTEHAPRLLEFAGQAWHLVNGNANGRAAVADSMYSLVMSHPSGQVVRGSMVVSPGGPAPELPVDQSSVWPEPRSEVLNAYDASGTQLAGTSLPASPNVQNFPSTSSARLVAGAGDSSSWCSRLGCTLGGPDGIMDWVVGSFPFTGRAAAVTTVYQNPTTLYNGPGADQSPLDTSSQIPRVRSQQELVDSYKSRALFELTSFGLNAMTMIGDTGVGWAVGDRGAIEKLGGGPPPKAADAKPPALGAHENAGLPDASPYDPFRPLDALAEAGTIPALATQPLRELDHQALVPAGTPDELQGQTASTRRDVATMVMSRDGEEGWALGPGLGRNGDLTLYHYAGQGWTRCNPQGIAGATMPDPACSALTPLLNARPQVRIVAATRVPLEADSDPSNDDDFEAVAVATNMASTKTGAKPTPIVLRYRDGRWSIEQAPETAALDQIAGTFGFDHGVDVAFTAPNDGWIVGEDVAAQTSSGRVYLFHYDGSRWNDCEATACGDPDQRVPTTNIQPNGSNPTRVRLAVAGPRVYLYGTRVVGSKSATGTSVVPNDETPFPFILRHDRTQPCQGTGGRGCWQPDGDSDPGFGALPGEKTDQQGQLFSLAVTRLADGAYAGWAVGRFGAEDAPQQANTDTIAGVDVESAAGIKRTTLWHLDGGAWRAWPADAVTAELTAADGSLKTGIINPSQQLQLPDGRALLAPRIGPLLGFGGTSWNVLSNPFTSVDYASPQYVTADVRALAPDGHGGAWLAVRQRASCSPCKHDNVYFYKRTDRVPEPVFDDVAHPIRERMTAAAGGPDGSFWVTTGSGLVYRHDRMTGWDRVSVPGWDPGRLVTNPTAANAIAIGPGGRGVLVGGGGRIADVGPGGAVLDAAAGTLCDPKAIAAPCGTSRTLRAAAVGPDGSAMVAGDGLALLWHSPGEGFHAIARPNTASTTITGVTLPTPGHAWISTTRGQIFAGELSDGVWRWHVEADSPPDGSLTTNDAGQALALRAIAIGANGHGFAVGDRGLIVEHVDGGWRRVDTGLSYDLSSIAVSATGGAAALIGGDYGIVLTWDGTRFRAAHEADPYDPLQGATVGAPSIAGVAVAGGPHAGEVEGWAALQGNQDTYTRDNSRLGAIFHYASNPDDPLLNDAARATPLPDAPVPRPGELRFAAFGKSDCRVATNGQCLEMSGTNRVNEVVSRRIVQAIKERAARPGGPSFAVFTGDASDTPGGAHAAKGGSLVGSTDLPTDAPVAQAAWARLVAGQLTAGGVPVFGAIGGQDLSPVQTCRLVSGQYQCAGTRQVPAGANLGWRGALTGMAAPWGAGASTSADGAHFEPVADGGQDAPGGGARTHYAVDLVSGQAKLLRLVFVDNSLGSLQAGDPVQNPVEAGGQTAWLKAVLDSRPPGEPTVVVANAPTYSYGPSSSSAAADGAAFEATLMAGGVSAVVSGRLGWNALYYATAAGLHEPCPGGSYPSAPPADQAPRCGPAASAPTGPEAAAQTVAETLRSLGAPPAPIDLPGTGAALSNVLPFVVAASAGGKFGTDGQANGAASDGFWHGYTIVRLDSHGDPRAMIVEQRPIFDWVGIRSASHVVHAGERVVLRGFGREAVGIDAEPSYDDIASPAITHRYDLLEADPRQPYLAKRDSAGDYVQLDPSVATVDSQTGRVTAGRGNHPRVYAIALLSAGDKAATYPLVFAPKRSYVAKLPKVIAAPAVPAIRVLGLSTQALQAPPSAPPPQTPPPVNTSLQLPAPPQLPVFPSATAPPIAPPVPPAPPPPPGQQQAPPLNLSVDLAGISLPPTPGVTAQPTPPVQPAPPGGARREARQKQAATAKSEEGTKPEGATEGGGGDAANGPPGPIGSSPMTRRDRVRPAADGFTPLARAHAQPSAWTTGLEWGGGLGLMALALALGFTGVRPTPRRRPPEVPAPAWNVRRRRDW